MLKRRGLEQLMGLGFGLVLLSATIAGVISVRGYLQIQKYNAVAAREARHALLAEQMAMLQQRVQATSRASFFSPKAAAISAASRPPRNSPLSTIS